MNDDIAKKQAESIKNTAKYWLAYINKLSVELNQTMEFYPLRQASLWSTTFSYIEWLLLFSIYETGKIYISAKNVAFLLNKYWGWDKEIGKIFWKSGRNPINHVGQANFLYSYDKYNNLPSNVSLDSSNRWTDHTMGEWGKYHPYKAVAILPPLKTNEEVVQIVTFFHQMLKDELLPILSEKIIKEILKETDKFKLNKLYNLNKIIPHLVV